MSSPQRKPIFGFIFSPRPDRAGAGQLRWIRIPARGPARLVLLLAATLTAASVAGAVLFALASVRSLTGLALGTLVIVSSLPLVALLVRGWVVGTYVNDGGVKICRWWSTTHVPWLSVNSIDSQFTFAGERLLLDTDFGPVATTMSSRSPDVWGRGETWLIARDRLRQWWRETRPMH